MEESFALILHCGVDKTAGRAVTLGTGGGGGGGGRGLVGCVPGGCGTAFVTVNCITEPAP